MQDLPYVVQPMALSDVDQVIEIEEAVFAAPWSARAYRFELTSNRNSTMIVVRRRRPPVLGLQPWRPRQPILGYAGFWLLVDEAHIATIGVRPVEQGKGLGELLLVSLLERARDLDVERATLEVRISNLKAQALYEKYGFEKVSLRKRYYADNDEDAFIMATPLFRSPRFEVNLAHRRAALYERLRAVQDEREAEE
ncbi:MAG: ribosomal protein S18-alanine N-acetyltransferase [Anaerolineae bacterium]|nr:ribosomal protein S18-alanine N-acetyltransferase [Anaerolineae bacterium]